MVVKCGVDVAHRTTRLSLTFWYNGRHFAEVQASAELKLEKAAGSAGSEDKVVGRGEAVFVVLLEDARLM